MTIGIIGATGYAGAELVRLLLGHPGIDKLLLSSTSFEGGKIEDVYPNFLGAFAKTGKGSGSLLKAEDVIEGSCLVFAALPHAVGEPYAAECMKRNIHYIDLSADFRFGDDEETYSAWYGKKYLHPELHKKSIYGLTEINRKHIREAADTGSVIIGNPGCYPTGAALGAFPAFNKDLVNTEIPVIVDAISGTSGGGREPQRSFHYSECADSLSAYKVASHRHLPEIRRNFSILAGKNGKPNIIFTPHLAPMNRGILSTIYMPLREKCRITSAEVFQKIYSDFYKDEPFIRVLPPGVTAATNRVRKSNFCDISVHVDVESSTLIVISAIDNMVKGAAGQAVQNMNVLLGYDETAGLNEIPALF